MQHQAKPQSLGTGSTNDQGQEKVDVPAQQTKGEFTLPLLFGSLWVLKGFGAAPLHWAGGGGLLYSVGRFAMLLSSGNALTDILRRNILAVIWASRSPVKLTREFAITAQPENGKANHQPGRLVDSDYPTLTFPKGVLQTWLQPSNPPVGSKLP